MFKAFAGFKGFFMAFLFRVLKRFKGLLRV